VKRMETKQVVIYVIGGLVAYFIATRLYRTVKARQATGA